MEIRAIPTALDGVVIIETAFVHDERGFFIETYHQENYVAQGLIGEFVQDNHSRSARGVLRGIHYQDMTAPMIKLVRCTAGSLLDVAVDLRVGSPTFGQSVLVELSAENKKQLWVPVGFGHAFVALTDGNRDPVISCSNYYAPASEGAIAWNDPDLAIDWPIADPLLSARDRAAMSLKDYLANPAFRAT